MADLDEIHSEVHALLQSATRENLLKVCAVAKIESEGKTTHALLRQVRRYLSSDDVEASEDEGLSVLQQMLQTLKATPSPEPTQMPTNSQQSTSMTTTEVTTGPIFRREFKILDRSEIWGRRTKSPFCLLCTRLRRV